MAASVADCDCGLGYSNDTTLEPVGAVVVGGGKICSPCASGTFKAVVGVGSCTFCPGIDDGNGTTTMVSSKGSSCAYNYTVVAGAWSRSLCQCRPGTTLNLAQHGYSCLPCPRGLFCPGGSVALVKEGFFRVKGDDVHTFFNDGSGGWEAMVGEVISCPGGNKKCLGPSQDRPCFDSERRFCSPGYRGLVSGDCGVNHFPLGPACLQCGVWQLYVMPSVLAAVVVCLAVAIFCLVPIQPNGTKFILLNFVQGLGMLSMSAFMVEEAVAHPGLQFVLQIFGSTLLSTSSLTCWFGSDSMLPVRLLAPLALPLVVASVLLLCGMSCSSCCVESKLWRVHNAFLHFMYGPLAVVTFIWLNCSEEEPLGLLNNSVHIQLHTHEPSMMCNETSTALGVVGLVLYIIGIPLMFIVSMFTRFRNSKKTLSRFGFVFTVYNKECWWWFLFDFLRRAVVAFAVVGLPRATMSTTHLHMIAFVTTVSFSTFAAFVKPFRRSFDNICDVVSFTMLAVSICASNALGSGPPGESNSLDTEVFEAVLVLDLLVLLVLIVVLVWPLFGTQDSLDAKAFVVEEFADMLLPGQTLDDLDNADEEQAQTRYPLQRHPRGSSNGLQSALLGEPDSESQGRQRAPPRRHTSRSGKSRLELE